MTSLEKQALIDAYEAVIEQIETGATLEALKIMLELRIGQLQSPNMKETKPRQIVSPERTMLLTERTT